MTEHGLPPQERERSPIRRLSATGDVTTGWHSSMQTTPHKSIGAFLLETIIAAGVVVAIFLLLAWLT
jgi:predicted secreted protein